MAVDDLFDGDPNGGQLPNPIPSLRAWLFAASMLVAAGPICCTGAFGGILSLWVWSRAGDAVARVDAGLHPAALARPARNVRRLAIGLMSTSLLSLLIQSILWGQGFYQSIVVLIFGAFGLQLNVGS